MRPLTLRRHVTIMGWRLRTMYPTFRRLGDNPLGALAGALRVEYRGVPLIYCRRCAREGKI